MNESSSIPPVINPTIAGISCGSHQPDPPLGEVESDRQPIASLITAIEAVLREPRRLLFQLTQQNQGHLVRNLLFVSLLSAFIYGLVVGTFSGREQLLAAPLKIAGGLLLSAVICLPSLYIFTCLSGARRVWARSAVCSLLSLL